MSETSPIRVVLADDHAMIRELLCAHLRAADIRVLGAAGDAGEASKLVDEHEPDIVVLDVDMPGPSAFDTAAQIRRQRPRTRIVFLGGGAYDHHIDAALRAGAMGFITKADSADAMLRALRSVAGGTTYYSPDVANRMVIDAAGPRLVEAPPSRASPLTAREREVLRGLAEGLPVKSVAERLDLSVGTVRKHTANLMRKLGVHNRAELTRYAIREGMLQA